MRRSSSSISARTGGSWPESGISLAMFTHWSPMRSTCLIMCSSAATSRRSPATGAWQREQREDALVDLEVAAVDAVVVGDHHRGELDVLVLERLEHAVELLDDHVEPAERRFLELLELLLEVSASLSRGHALYPNLPVTYSSVRLSSGFVKIFSVGGVLDELAVEHERRAVGHARRLLHVVRDDHDRVARP